MTTIEKWEPYFLVLIKWQTTKKQRNVSPSRGKSSLQWVRSYRRSNSWGNPWRRGGARIFPFQFYMCLNTIGRPLHPRRCPCDFSHLYQLSAIMIPLTLRAKPSNLQKHQPVPPSRSDHPGRCQFSKIKAPIYLLFWLLIPPMNTITLW